MSSSIKKGAIFSYIAIFVNIAVTFFYTPWMIKKIGVSDYGLYSLVISFISYFIMDFGLHQAVQRFIAKYRAEDDEDKVGKMVGITTRVYLIIDAVIFLILLVLFFFITNIFKGLTIEEIEKLKGLYVIAATFSVLNFMFKPMAGAMMAYEYFVEERALEMVNKVGLVLLVCVALYFGAGVYTLVLINGAVSLFVSIAKFYVFRRKSKLKIKWGYYDKGELKNIFSFSMWTFCSGLAQRLRISLVPTLLGILSNSHEIAVYALGAQIEGMVFTLSTGINGLFLPKVSRMMKRQEREDVLDLMIQIGRIQLLLIGLIFCGFVLFGHFFIHLWIGDEFTLTYLVVIFLIIANLVSLTQHIAVDVIYVENKIRDMTIRLFITSLGGFIIASLLAPSLGAVGCAIGTCVGLCVYLVWINVYYQQVLGIDIKKFFQHCHLKILPVLVLYSAIVYSVFMFVDMDSWVKLIVSISLYVIVFFVLCYFFVFNEQEKKLIHIKKI